MIYNGICPYCSGQLVEARVRLHGSGAVIDGKGPLIKTKCSQCGVFIGYRPVDPRKVRPAKELEWMDNGER